MAVAGRKNNGNGELVAHLADLKKSEALRASQAPELRRYLEQLNSVQGLFALGQSRRFFRLYDMFV